MVLALRLWLVLHSRVVVPRESVSLMAVAGSGKYRAGPQTPECTATAPLGLLRALCAQHTGSCSFVASPEPAPSQAICSWADASALRL